MYLDILIFASIAAFLVWRLMSVLGTRHGGERERPNPFAPRDEAPKKPEGKIVDVTPLEPKNTVAFFGFGDAVDDAANKDGRVETGIAEIAAADPMFEINSFMQGARYAFEMIVTAYAKGDLETLKPLLSHKLYADFAAGIKARIAAGHTSEMIVHRITKAKIIEAHLGGTMAYITVDFDVEETAITRDRDGKVVDGDPDRIFSVEDIWTFTRDTRAHDPNWTLIETRTVEKE